MEINAQPDRMDLSDLNARLARDRGVRFVIDTDAHSVNQLDHVRYGVFVARRAGLTKHEVLNTLPLERFRKVIRKGGTPVTAKPAKSPAAMKPAAHAGDGSPSAQKAATKAVTKAAPKATSKTTTKKEATRKAPAKKASRRP